VPHDIDEKEMFYGASVAYTMDLVGYWLSEFDWRAAERQLNAFDNY
jgi:hypothetical protein